MLIDVLAQVVPPDGVGAPVAAPVIQGLSPNMQALITILTMLVPLGWAMLQSWQRGRTLNSVIVGAEKGSNSAVAGAQALLARAVRGEKVTPEEVAKVVEGRFKTGIQEAAILDGTEDALAPRVKKVTDILDADELKKRLGAVILFVVFLGLSGCASVRLEHVDALDQALKLERRAVVPVAGLEEEVKKHRAAQDKVILEMRKACQ